MKFSPETTLDVGTIVITKQIFALEKERALQFTDESERAHVINTEKRNELERCRPRRGIVVLAARFRFNTP